MNSIQKLMLTAGLCAGIAVPTTAFAGDCKVIVTDGGTAQEGVMVEARGPDGQQVAPQKTNAEGLVVLSAEMQKFEIRVKGMDAGTCEGHLMVDLSNLGNPTSGDATHAGPTPATTANGQSEGDEKAEVKPDAGRPKSGTTAAQKAKDGSGSGKAGTKAAGTKKSGK